MKDDKGFVSIIKRLLFVVVFNEFILMSNVELGINKKIFKIVKIYRLIVFLEKKLIIKM